LLNKFVFKASKEAIYFFKKEKRLTVFPAIHYLIIANACLAGKALRRLLILVLLVVKQVCI
jgi:hypothetical protein